MTEEVLKNPRVFGEQYNKLTVIGRADRYVYASGHGVWNYWCICECGNIKKVRGDRLRKDKPNQSCGCSSYDHLKTHNLSSHELYGTYNQMVRRCTVESHAGYHDYGGRGIRVCDRWLLPDGEGLRNFIEDMGERPEGYSLERVDNDGDYCPENCCWADRPSQMRNRRKKKGSKTKSKGVTEAKKGFVANICLGSFESEQDAAKAYDNVYEILYGSRPNNTIKDNEP